MSGHTGFYLPPPYEGDKVQRFGAPSGTNGWLTWDKPAGANMITIVMAGGGAGGGNGHSAAAAAARGGGGGGGSAALARITVPAWMLPSNLYIQVGSGGAANGNGTASFVSVFPSTAASNVILTANGGGAGGNGTGAAAGAAGAAGTASTSANAILSAWGVPVFVGGQAGTIGGVQTGGTPATLTPHSVSFLSGGSGGAGVAATDFAGAAIAAVTPWPSIPGGVVTGGAGSPGRELWTPCLFTGGTGGGSNNSGVGGAGGAGAPGCGGGGGGGGVTGGGGGRGGNGFVWIIAS